METPIVFLIRNYASYNSWANKTLVDWLRTKPAEVLAKEVPSSFPTVKGTLEHMWSAQRYWHSVINGITGERPAPVEADLDGVFDGFVAQSQAMADDVKKLTEAQITEQVRVVNPWFECNYPLFEYVMQVMNHNTYHRGQIVTIGRNLGLTDAPMTDYNYYNVYGRP